MKKQLFMMVLAVLMAGVALADLTTWQAQATATAGNVVSDNTGWTFDGDIGPDDAVYFDFGDLDDDDDPTTYGTGSTIEFIFNLADAGAASVLAVYGGYNGELNLLKHEQYNNTGKLGITTRTYPNGDYTFAADSPYDVDAHVAFVFGTDGSVTTYVDGVDTGTFLYAEDGDWIANGGSGTLGAWDKNGDGSLWVGDSSGTIYAVGTYDRALTGTEVAVLYSSVVPEPATLALLGLGSLVLRRRRK